MYSMPEVMKPVAASVSTTCSFGILHPHVARSQHLCVWGVEPGTVVKQINRLRRELVEQVRVKVVGVRGDRVARDRQKHDVHRSEWFQEVDFLTVALRLRGVVTDMVSGVEQFQAVHFDQVGETLARR